MKSIIKNNIINFMYDKKKISILIIFAFFCGKEIIIAKLYCMSIWEYGILVLGNHYYTIYFMLVAYIFLQSQSIKQENDLINIRIKKYSKIFIIQLITYFLQTCIFVLAHAAIVLSIGLFLLSSNNTHQTTKMQEYFNDTVQFVFGYRNYFNNPCEGFILTIIYMIIGLTFVSMIIYILKKIIGFKFTMFFLLIIFLNIMIGFKTGINGKYEIFFLNNYFILHHVLLQNGFGFVSLNIAIEALGLITGFYIIKKKNVNKRKMFLISYSKWKYSIIALLIFIIINYINVLLSEGKIVSMDCMIANLIGYSPTDFSLFEFTKYIIFFGIPLFTIGDFLEQKNKIQNSQIIIRFKNKRTWQTMLEKNINRYIFRYIVIFEIIMILLFICSIVSNNNSNYMIELLTYYNIKKYDLFKIILIILITKPLELIYYLHVFYLLKFITNSVLYSFLGTFAGFSITFILNNVFITYGCSSINMMLEKIKEYKIGIALIIIPAILIIKITILSFIKNYYLHSKCWKSKNI